MRRRKALALWVAITIVLVSSWRAYGYELLTHVAVSQQAFDLSTRLRSYAEDVAIKTDGIFDPDDEAQGSTAFSGFNNLGTPRDWLAAGAIREDDYLRSALLEALGCSPPLNPQSSGERIDRPKSHFFDVQRGGGGLAVAGGLPARDWALGLQGWGPSPTENHFALPDARVYQFRSLTQASPVERERQIAKLFRTLGQIAHVLQDMAQPQHTRNDPHLGCHNAVLQFIGGDRSWFEVYTDTRATNQRYRGRSDASRPLVLAGYGPVGFQTYRDYWANAAGSGLAEFSSRNFFSAGTNLGTFSVAGLCGGLPQPDCSPQAYATEEVDFSIPTLSGETLAGRIRFYLRDIPDLLSGQVISNVRVSTRSLWDQHLETNQGQRKFSLNTYNYDAMADVLLPRAVGYSAGLLDYFFRGQLDLHVERAQEGDPPVDTNRLRLVGTNASAEDMVNGSLAILYERQDGERVPVQLTSPAPDPNNPGVVAGVSAPASAPLPPVEFVEPAEAAVKYIVAYQGTLGQEQAGSPSGFGGAVVGKVVPVGWVERISAATPEPGSPRLLTNATGQFTFPPEVDGLERRRFGDLNNWVVGTAPASVADNPLLPDQVRAFQIDRAVDSTEVPLAPPSGSEPPSIRLASSRIVNFPYGLDLGVDVNFTSTVQSGQQLIVIEWEVGSDLDSRRVQLPAPTVATATASWSTRLTLDKARLDLVAGPNAGPYVWRLAEVGLDRQGRLLALVEVRVNAVGLVTQTSTEQRLNDACEIVPTFPLFATAGNVPDVGSIWAVIDVGAGQVVGVSSAPIVNIGLTGTGGFRSAVYIKKISHGESGTTIFCSLPFDAATLPNDVPVVGTVALPPSVTERTLTGQYRDGDLKQVVGTELTPFTGTTTSTTNYTLVVNGILQAAFAVRTEEPFAGQSGYLTLLREGMRLAPAEGQGAEYLLRFARPVGTAVGDEEGVLARWVPETPARTALALPGELSPGTYALKAVTPKWALVQQNGGAAMLLADLDRRAIIREYGFPQATQLTNDFVLLAPRNLYNVENTHFHVADAVLTPTALPSALSGAPFVDPDPGAGYQLISPR